MLGTDAGVVQAGADAVGLGDLAILVLQDVGAVAVQHAGLAQLQRGRVLAALQTLASGLDADQARLVMRNIGVEDAHRIAAATDAGHDRIGLQFSAVARQAQLAQHLGHLGQAFLADHALEVAHHHRIGVRAGHGANDVEGVLDVGDPVAHRLVQGVLQRLAAGLDRHHGGAEQLHAVDVGALALDVLGPHVDHALEAVAGADGRGRDAMLAGAGLGDHARLAHALGEHGLADHVVDLVCAGVIQVLALEEDLRAAHLAAGARGVVDRRGTADEMLELVMEFGQEGRVMLVLGVGVLEFLDRVRQRFADEAAAVGTEMALHVGLVVVKHGRFPIWCGRRLTRALGSGNRVGCRYRMDGSLGISGRVGLAHGSDEAVDQLGVLDALGGLHARAHVNRPRAYETDAIDHICRCESTRQNEASAGV